MQRLAILSIPAEIHSTRELVATATITWREPISLFVSAINLKGVTYFYGDLQVFDEADRPVQSWYSVSMPPIPNVFRELRRGDSLTAPIYTAAGFALDQPGSYYVVATLGYFSSGGKPVIFKTQKAWFTFKPTS